MHVFIPQKLVLLSVPKTGSTALELATGPRASILVRLPLAERHVTASGFALRWAPFLKQSFGFSGETVAVMRHPVERLGSWYRYRRRLDPATHPRSTREISFDDFVEAAISGDSPVVDSIGNQHRFLTDAAGEVAVTHIFSYDAFDRAVAFLGERLGGPLKVPKHNVSGEMALPLDPALLKRLRTARLQEFELYDRVSAEGHLHTRDAVV